MSRLSELIRDLCPDGVEYRPLGELAYIRTGSPVSKSFIQSHPGPYPVYNSGRKPFGYVDQYNVEDDPIGIASRGAGVGSVSWCEGRYYRGPLNYSVTIKNSCLVGARYLYHYLVFSARELRRLCSLQGIPALNKSQLQRMAIAVPPPGVQQEIVRILDQFTTLEASLKAEMEARRKQYEYYRELLMRGTSAGDVMYKTLEELFVTRNGYTPNKNDASAWESSDIPWFRMEDIREDGGILSEAQTCVSSSAVKGGRVFPANSILVATSATIGAHALITVPHLSNQRFTSLQLKEEYRGAFDNKFLYYYCFLLDEHCLKNVHVSSFASVEMKAFRSFKFPMVPLEVQWEIVRILDQFTMLEAELEAELEARRKQYEYYRNMVLTFPERRR